MPDVSPVITRLSDDNVVVVPIIFVGVVPDVPASLIVKTGI